MTKTFEQKKNKLFIILSGIFLTNALVAEMIGVKIFSAEAVAGIAPAQLIILGFTLDFNLTAGVVLWPVVFITTDIINEYFGREGVKRISYLTAGLIAYAFVVIYIATLLPPANFWLDINKSDAAGNAFNINYAFQTIFRQGLGIIVGSLTAFLVGQLLDVFIFQRLRRVTGSNYLWLRATGSTLVSQLIDSFVVLGIAFYIFGNWSMAQVLSVGIINYMYKFTVAIFLTPVIYAGHYIIDRYLGKNEADKLSEEAAASSQGFF
ncbi:MAG: queuosine precursor transporter [Flammeovirgaceae bacterium]|nr:queuosine precursor transporter [Flammeovirgaceae bacterium]